MVWHFLIKWSPKSTESGSDQPISNDIVRPFSSHKSMYNLPDSKYWISLKNLIKNTPKRKTIGKFFPKTLQTIFIIFLISKNSFLSAFMKLIFCIFFRALHTPLFHKAGILNRPLKLGTNSPWNFDIFLQNLHLIVLNFKNSRFWSARFKIDRMNNFFLLTFVLERIKTRRFCKLSQEKRKIAFSFRWILGWVSWLYFFF
jgi:hypothetical protein